MEKIISIYMDTFKKIWYWFGYALYLADRLNEKVFDLICKRGWFGFAGFIRTRGTRDDDLFLRAAGQALGMVILLTDEDDQLLFRCLYGLKLYKNIFGFYWNKVKVWALQPVF
jgi:hypothetical protein